MNILRPLPKTELNNFFSKYSLKVIQYLDDTTISLIPRKLHGNIPHIRSASDLRNQN